ncbi:MAG: hypothetical protein WD965_05685 [Actinomycetota bacterium]
MTLETVSFEGHDCVRLEDGDVTVIVTISAGPRVIGMLVEGENLFAVLPDATLDGPDGERFRFHGGHRLWVAPEVPSITYRSDDRACAVTEIEGGVAVEAPQDGARLAKTITVRSTSQGWIIDHAVRNATPRSMTVAPWAITQFRTGGEAFLPIAPRERGPQADRSLVLWPYTDLGDPRIRLDRGEVRVDAVPSGAPLKLGAAPGDGWAAYRLGKHRFEKRVDVDPSATYPDRGAAVQVYLCDEFCELETLGPLEVVPPGETVTHREHWTLARATVDETS